ncbi:MAG: hypothetical protein WCI74_12610 [Actinomycetes bacterium]
MDTPSGLAMPAHLVERARLLVAGRATGWTPPPLRDAATVVMVCDADDGLQVYLQRRVRTMVFAAGMYVFPGGAVDPADRDRAREIITTAPDKVIPDELRADIDDDGAGLGLDTLSARLAAVREVQEEANHDLADPMALRYVAHWATPEVEDRRYDTRFYAVALPRQDAVYESSRESDHERWVRPQDALDDYAAGTMAMLPPTVSVLWGFARAVADGHDAVGAIEVLARQRIVPLMPAPVADTSREEGIRWALIDFRTGQEFTSVVPHALDVRVPTPDTRGWDSA